MRESRSPRANYWHGKAFRQAREARGLSRTAVAKGAGLSAQHLRNMEVNLCAPSLEILALVRSFLGLDIFELSEVLRIDYFPPADLRKFRAACRRQGRAPLEVLQEFVRVYADVATERGKRT